MLFNLREAYRNEPWAGLLDAARRKQAILRFVTLHSGKPASVGKDERGPFSPEKLMQFVHEKK